VPLSIEKALKIHITAYLKEGTHVCLSVISFEPRSQVAASLNSTAADVEVSSSFETYLSIIDRLWTKIPV
jgi:hypothetical protein